VLSLNVTGSSEKELQKLVTERCEQYGTVTSITVMMVDETRGYAVAAVEMSTTAETHTVMNKFGDSKAGSMVIIRLEQQEKVRPPARRRR
jgi:hypothetical protein